MKMHIIVIKSCKSLNPGHPDSDKKDERINRINTDKVDISKYATSGIKYSRLSHQGTTQTQRINQGYSFW
jgi:hypothetical protein